MKFSAMRPVDQDVIYHQLIRYTVPDEYDNTPLKEVPPEAIVSEYLNLSGDWTPFDDYEVISPCAVLTGIEEHGLVRGSRVRRTSWEKVWEVSG